MSLPIIKVVPAGCPSVNWNESVVATPSLYNVT